MSKIANFIQSIPNNITLVAVTKYSDKNSVQEAIKKGITHIGESRVESIDKIKNFNVKKHFIGPIQSNKIKKIVQYFDCIQSVSTIPHLIKIENSAKQLDKNIEVLLQLKISPEESKQGIGPDKLDNFFNIPLEKTKILGFMVIASKTNDENKLKSEFKEAKIIFDKYKQKYNLTTLSMGMSNDYALAIKHGSNMIRIGSLIFK